MPIRIARPPFAATALAAIVALSACVPVQRQPASQTAPAVTEPGPMPSAARMAALDLRGRLTSLFDQHVMLATSAGAAAFIPRSRALRSAAGALDRNAADLAGALAAVYGSAAVAPVHAAWRGEGEALVSYARASAEHNRAGEARAYDQLVVRGNEVAATLARLMPALDQAAAASALKRHADAMRAVIDAIAIHDDPGEFFKLRQAYEPIDTLAALLSTAVIRQFPGRFAWRETENPDLKG